MKPRLASLGRRALRSLSRPSAATARRPATTRLRPDIMRLRADQVVHRGRATRPQRLNAAICLGEPGAVLPGVRLAGSS